MTPNPNQSKSFVMLMLSSLYQPTLSIMLLTQKCYFRAFAPPLAVPKIPEGEKVDFDVSDSI